MLAIYCSSFKSNYSEAICIVKITEEDGTEVDAEVDNNLVGMPAVLVAFYSIEFSLCFLSFLLIYYF